MVITYGEEEEETQGTVGSRLLARRKLVEVLLLLLLLLLLSPQLALLGPTSLLLLGIEARLAQHRTSLAGSLPVHPPPHQTTINETIVWMLFHTIWIEENGLSCCGAYLLQAMWASRQAAQARAGGLNPLSSDMTIDSMLAADVLPTNPSSAWLAIISLPPLPRRAAHNSPALRSTSSGIAERRPHTT
jgi:hypothetical protein